MAGLRLAAPKTPEPAERLVTALGEASAAGWSAMVDRARGELHGEPTGQLLPRVPPALITNRALLGEPPLSAMQIDELVDAVMLPALHAANPRPQSPHPRDHHHDIEV
ncbi:TetR-like C-terminal domain-containing protein [Micromonospora phytophila]|uniref:TetR-like C-terminal domain-containing protein n=1 Tax=Micromonospora phytophila TaxID=709888 RepID=UPI00355732FE